MASMESLQDIVDVTVEIEPALRPSFAEDFGRRVREICEAHAREPQPSFVAVSPAAAPVLNALNEAHARGDTRTVSRIGSVALAALMAKPTASR